MADSPALVGLGFKSPDIGGKLSQLLSIKQQQQQLRAQTAEASGAEQTQNQRAALADYMSHKVQKHLGEDGTYDLNSIASDPELAAAAGDKYQDVLGQMADVKNHQLAAKDSLVKLRGDQRAAFGQMIGALRSNKDVLENSDKGKQLVNQAMEQFGTMYGEDALPVLRAYAAPLQRTADPDATLKAVQQQTMSADAQAAAQQPNFVNTGKKLKQVGTGAAPTDDIGIEVPPGAQVLTDGKGAQFLWNPSDNSVKPIGTGKGGASASAPESASSPTAPPAQKPASGFTQPTYPGYDKDIAANQDEVSRVRAAADTAPQNRDIFKHILKLADDTNTGPLVNFFQKTAIGGQVFGDNYQELAKYLEKQAIGQMQAMGGPASDARLSAAVAANGSTTFNPKALKAVTQFNHAVNTGLEEYRQGIDQAVGTSNADYTALPRFKSDWAKNFSIDVFRLQNAIADGDEHAKAEVLNGLSDKEADGLVKKLDNLESLSKTGHLPK
jgi:hypothetical protein